jgi:hypothetical protein
MPCPHCDGRQLSEPFYDTVDAQGQLRWGAWRWAARCTHCGGSVRDDDAAAKARSSAMEEPRPAPAFRMF